MNPSELQRSPEEPAKRKVLPGHTMHDGSAQSASTTPQPESDQPPDSYRTYWQWFGFCAIFLAILFFPFGALELSAGSIALVLVLAAGAAFVNLIFRPEGPSSSGAAAPFSSCSY
jgi:hypothetical protein